MEDLPANRPHVLPMSRVPSMVMDDEPPAGWQLDGSAVHGLDEMLGVFAAVSAVFSASQPAGGHVPFITVVRTASRSIHNLRMTAWMAPV